MRISQHAAVRYLDRVLGLDMQLHFRCMEVLGYDPKKHIGLYFWREHGVNLSALEMPEAVRAASACNAGTGHKFSVKHDGFRYIFCGRRLVTVTPVGSPKAKRRRKNATFAEAA